VTGDTLPLHDGGHVDLILHLFISLDHTIRHRDAKVTLAFEHRDPIIAFQSDFALWRPKGAHGSGGVAFSEDVGNGIGQMGAFDLGQAATNRKSDAGPVRFDFLLRNPALAHPRILNSRRNRHDEC
jgi:hypothetical protein